MTYQLAFTALSDPTRRVVFESLRKGPQTVSELAAQQPVSRPAVSQHLKVLHEAQLVTVKAEGRKRIYSLHPDGIQSLREYIDQFWTDALSAFQDEVNRRKGNNHHA